MDQYPGFFFQCRADETRTMFHLGLGCDELTGYAAEDLIQDKGVTFKQLIHPEDWNLVWKQIAAAMLEGMPYQVSYRLRTRDGGAKWVLEQGRAIQTKEGSAIEGFITDISHQFGQIERRSLQQDLLLSVRSASAQARDLQDLLDKGLNHCLQIFDLQYGLIWIGEYLHILNFPNEALAAVLEPLKSYLDSRRKSKAVENWEEEFDSDELSIIAQTSTEFDLHASLLIPILSENRYVGGICLFDQHTRQWTIEDIVLAEAIGSHLGESAGRLDLLDAIQKQARMLQRILDTVQEGIFTLDGEKRILVVNKPAREFLSLLAGKGAGEILVELGGKPIEHFLTPRADGLPHEVEVDKGAHRIFEVHTNPVAMGNDEAGWTLLLRDVTEVRQIQARVQEQIRRGAVGQLAAGIAHDFNNIVAAIILYSEMVLAMPELPEKGRQRLSTIIEQANRAATLTRQILDFSRRGIMEPHPMDLVPYFDEMTGLLERTLPENIELEFHYGTDEYIVNIDPGRLQQVLMNLAVNAREAMPTGGKLTLDLARVEIGADDAPPIPDMPHGKWVELIVSDTGIGIPEADLPRIFEPFFTTKPSGESAGLGLAQVFGIITQHDGFIQATSDQGKGSVFTIYLPALSASQLSGLIPAEEKPIEGQMETILVVEDDRAMREALVEMLEMMNYRILSAANGREALSVISKGDEIDLVLSDLVMPEMGGVALYAEIKERYPQIKMVVMTGYPLAEGGKDLLEQGIVAWLQKPLDVETLGRTMRKVLAVEVGA